MNALGEQGPSLTEKMVIRERTKVGKQRLRSFGTIRVQNIERKQALYERLFGYGIEQVALIRLLHEKSSSSSSKQEPVCSF